MKYGEKEPVLGEFIARRGGAEVVFTALCTVVHEVGSYTWELARDSTALIKAEEELDRLVGPASHFEVGLIRRNYLNYP